MTALRHQIKQYVKHVNVGTANMMEMTFIIDGVEYTVMAPDAITGLALAQELAAQG